MHDGNISPVRVFFRNKWVWLVIALDFCAIVGVIVFGVLNSMKNSIIEFMITPIDANISVNGDSSYYNGSFQLYPGTYEIVISHESLEPKTFTIDLQENSSVTITTFLGDDGDFDYYELRDNYSSYLMLERIASSSDNQTTDHDTSAEEFIADFQRNYNLYSTQLPLAYSEYGDDEKLVKYVSVRAKYDCAMTLCLDVSMYYEDDKSVVNSLLLGAGFDVEDFEIEYVIY